MADGTTPTPTPTSEVWRLASGVTDPELPMLTLADLGVLRDVTVNEVGAVTITITPTYSGCPAMAAMRDDLCHVLADHGLHDVEIRVSLHPAWSSAWISDHGRRTLRQHGISAPGAVPSGPVALDLRPPRRSVRCPRCDSVETDLVSEFGATACRAVYRCSGCLETFDHVKEI